MSIIGFNFTKIQVDSKEGAGNGKVNINSNVNIKKVEKKDLNLGNDKQGTLKFDFEFTVKYEPEIGNMLLGGNILMLLETKKATDIAKSWKDKKEVPAEIMESVMNMILTKSNIEALILSQHVNLPPPVRLPRVKAEAKNSTTII